MNEFERARRDCHLSIKTWQNLSSSLSAFTRLCELVDLKDHLIISSLFQMAVVKYTKPFLKNDSGNGRVSFPIKKLKKTPGFNSNVHKHLIDIRNTLIAHDDFNEVLPKILITNMVMSGTEFSIPMSIIVSNKCVSHPSDLSVAHELKNHVAAAVEGSLAKLNEDIERIRKIAIDEQEQVGSASKYSRTLKEKINIPVGGGRIEHPDFSGEPWLNVDEPNFSDIHNGFMYEEVRLKRDFNGPEKIELPNGHYVVIGPNNKTE